MIQKTTPIEEELDIYYEWHYFNYPKTISFDDATLYVEGEQRIYTELAKEDYNPDNILDYRVMYEESGKTTEYYPITKEIYDLLGSYDSYSIKFINGTKDYYFVAMTFIEGVGDYYGTVYDKNGKKIEALSKIDSSSVNILNNGMIIATIDGKTGIYDEDYNLLTTIEDYKHPNVVTIDGNTITLTGYSQDGSNTNKIYTLRTYEALDGDEQEYNGEETLSIRFSGDVKLFKNLYINDKLIDKKNYTIKSGSTIVTFKADYLAELGKGEYTVVAEYTDGGTATASFEILKVANIDKGETIPDTYDGITSYIVVVVIASAGIIVLRSKLKEN